jgi:transmembrane sensor
VGDVTGVGTRFDLEASGAQLRLMVVEGRVLLSNGGPETPVNGGQQARIVEGMSLPVVAVRPEDIRLDWLGNFLAFQDTPLREAVREIERQFRVRFDITDSLLASQTVTGWFSGWPLDQVVDVVCTVTNAQCTATTGLVTMRPRGSPIP